MVYPSTERRTHAVTAQDELLDWDCIDTVLLDMDGTLLDLNFDNHFWTKHVPLRFAEANGISIEQARGQIFPHMRKIRGTLNWYCIHYWSNYLALDIGQLKVQIAHLVKPRPGIFEFLDALRKHDKLVLLATNAHQDTVSIKFSRVDLVPYFHHIFTSHELETPKEKPAFWARLQHQVPFDKSRTLLIDDNAEVLGSAREFGIGHLLTIARPDLEQPPQANNGFIALDHFNQITPGD
jgi:HAD superfamily hydrolase (TIGR01509 family)